jgi:hypothetical protein
LMALSITTGTALLIVMTAPAAAQLFPSSPGSSGSSDRTTIRAGAIIPVRYDEAEKIVVSPQERMRLTLAVAANITNRNGAVLIPEGSLIEGELTPADGGSQFIASNLVIDGRRQSINASSDVITTTQIRKGANTSSILTGAVVGAAAGAALGGLTGNRRISAGEVLLGTGIGAAGGAILGRNQVDVVVINPDTDLDLILDSSLTVDRF